MVDSVEHLVGFVHALRSAGVAASPSRGTEFLRAAAILPAQDLYWAGRHTLLAAASEIDVYDRVFVEFFGSGTHATREQLIVTEPELALADGATDEGSDDGDSTGSPVSALASDAEILRTKSFAAFSEEELTRLAALLRSLRLAPPPRRTRRWQPARRGEPDPRRTVRRALRSGGDPVQRAWRRRRRRPRRLVLILDVSHSMSDYSRALLLFARAGLLAHGRGEVFCFGTRLTRVTGALSGPAPGEALMRAADEVVDWDSGTRIGESLKQFLDMFGHAGLARGALVVICSDGLETGDPALVGEQMARLSRLAHQVFWLNPLKEDVEYQPLARGMAAALPYIDVFVSGHNLASLEEVAEVLMDSWGDPRQARRRRGWAVRRLGNHDRGQSGPRPRSASARQRWGHPQSARTPARQHARPRPAVGRPRLPWVPAWQTLGADPDASADREVGCMNEQDIDSDPAPGSGEDGDGPDQGLVDETAQRIQRRIIEGELPVGTWLRQSRIAADLGVSRTPVREALRKLQAMGLVEVVPRRGAQVRRLDTRVFSESFVVRAELEGLAAELAAELADDDQLERLEKAAAMFDESVKDLEARPVRSWEDATWKANDLFHEIILDAADNFCLTRALQDLHLRVSSNAAWGTVLTRRTHILRRNMAEHREILTAIQQHDCAKARAAMRTHVLRTGELVAKALRT